MAFNTVNKRKVKASPGPVATSPVSTGLTGNGAPGYAYDDKSALFMLGAGSFFGQDKFYAKGDPEAARFVDLVQKVTKADPVWMLDFITWLRASGNIRSAAVVASVESSRVAPANPNKGATATGWARGLARAGIGRADEIGEAVAYFQSRYPGKQLPKPLKRGLADVMITKVDEYTAMKYKGDGKSWSLGQLINVLHPKGATAWQNDLFGYLVAREYGDVEIPASLVRLRSRDRLMKYSVAERRAVVGSHLASEIFKEAGLTWEALAGWLQGPMDAKAWEAIIPSMGYMALLRNLRNFDEAGVSNTVANGVANLLSAQHQVARSKQFPFRFLAAYRAAPNLRWASALSMALNASLTNIPKLPGRTLVMVDTSGSMNTTFSEHSEMKMWDAAALFGIALGLAGNQVDVYSYSNREIKFELRKGADVLSELDRWGKSGFNQGGGTDTAGSTSRSYRGHDRVIILTDEQANYGGMRGHSYYGGSVDQSVPADRHMFTFNLAGYRMAHAPTGKFRHAFGGLTDACFPLIDRIERAQSGTWPWESQD